MLIVFIFCRQRGYLHVPLPPNFSIGHVDEREGPSTKTLSFTDELSTHKRDFKRVYKFSTISAGCAGHSQHCLLRHEAETEGIILTIFTTRPGTQ